MANLKTMQAAAEAVTKGEIREAVAKRFKISVSTLDNWRQKVAGGTKINGTIKTVTANRTVRKSDTALRELERENVALLATVGDLYMRLAEATRIHA